MESISEAIPQLILSSIVLHSYGLSSEPRTLASQTFSIVSSFLSLLLAFGLVRSNRFVEKFYNTNIKLYFQRNTSTKTNVDETVTRQKQCNLKKILSTFISVIGKILYSFIPISLYTCCLYIEAVSRKSVGSLTVVMGAMLHPIVAIPIGVTAKIVSSNFGTCLPNKLKKQRQYFNKFSSQ